MPFDFTKKDFPQVLSCEIFEIFEDTFFKKLLAFSVKFHIFHLTDFTINCIFKYAM